MNREDYKKKLIAFNSTPKYKLEQDFLLKNLNPQPNEKILDYGTGLGRLVHLICDDYKANCYGYDQHNLREHDSQFLFRSEYHFKFNKVFFMHSISHIAEIAYKLKYLKDYMLEPEATVFVITPNRSWLSFLSGSKEYVADPTVINHFSAAELRDLFTTSGFKLQQLGQFGAIHNGQHERLFLSATI